MNHQLLRFLAVGLTAVAIDFASYSLFLTLGSPIAPAKALGFVAGAVFAYIANRDWTFQAKGGAAVMLRFALLYLASLGCNVAVNALALDGLPAGGTAHAAAFLAATIVSASINYLGMKYLVFHATPKGAAS